MGRDICDGEWTTFDKYSGRIHQFSNIFSSSGVGSPDIDHTIFERLQRLKGKPLFPRLRTILIHLPLPGGKAECPSDGHGYIGSLTPFVQPTLLRVHIIGQSSALLGLVVRLTQTSPYLEQLRIKGPIDPRILKVIPRFQNLMACDFDFDDAMAVQRFQPSPTKKRVETYTEMMRMLSTIKGLSTLLLSLPVMLPPALPIQFHSLKRLAIKTTTCAKFATILSLIPRLEHLLVCVPLLVREECEVLGSHIPSHSPLRHLELRSFKAEKHTLTLSFLQPFMKLELETLIMESCVLEDVEISDLLVSEIAIAWPRLCVLHLFSSSFSATLNTLSLKAIIHLARACPFLTDLRLGRTGWQRPDSLIAPFEQILGPNFYTVPIP